MTNYIGVHGIKVATRDTIRRREAQDSVLSIDNTPPVSTNAGDRYIVGTSPTGVWVGHGNDIAIRNDADADWDYITPEEGFQCWVDDINFNRIFEGVNWSMEPTEAPGSDGNVIYNNGGVLGALTGFTFDDSNTRLGIGQDTPLYKLHVEYASNEDGKALVYNSENDTAALATITARTNSGDLKVGISATTHSTYSGDALIWNEANTNLLIGTNNTERFRITSDGKLIAGNYSTSTEVDEGGLILYQAANDGDILAVKSSDVGHAMTNIAEANTYGTVLKASGALGGLAIRGFAESSGTAVQLYACGTSPDTTSSNAGVGVISIVGQKDDSANGVTNVGNTENLLSVVDYDTTLILVKGDGTTHWTVGGIDLRTINATGCSFVLPNTTTGATGALRYTGSDVEVYSGSSWDAIGGGGGGTPGGLDTQLQVNDGGSFGGIDEVTWDDTNHYLKLGTNTRLLMAGLTTHTTSPITAGEGCIEQKVTANNEYVRVLHGSGVSHGMTSILPATAYAVEINETTAGGHYTRAWGGSITPPITIEGVAATPDTSTGPTSRACVEIRGLAQNSTTWKNLASDENLLLLGNLWNATRMIVKGNGDTYGVGKIVRGAGTTFFTTPDCVSGGMSLRQASTDTKHITLQGNSIHTFSSLDDTRTYGKIGAANSGGGLNLQGYGKSTGLYGLYLSGYSGAPNSTSSTSGQATIMVRGATDNGSTGATALADANNMVAWRNYTSTKMILKGNGQLLFTGNGGPDLRTTGSTTNKLILPNTTTGETGALRFSTTVDVYDGADWIALGGSVGGADTEVQFNDGGSPGGDPDFAWNKTSHYLLLGSNTKILTGGLTSPSSVSAAYLSTGGIEQKITSAGEFSIVHGSSIAHGITGWLPTSIFYAGQSSHVTNGGTELKFWGEGASYSPLVITGGVTTPNTVTTTASRACIELRGGKKSSTLMSGISSDENLLLLGSSPSQGSGVKVLVKGDGSLYSGGKLVWNRSGFETDPDCSLGGMCLNQNIESGNHVTLKGTFIHQFSSLDDTDTYLVFKRYQISQGGCAMKGYGTSNYPGLSFYGYSQNVQDTETTSSTGLQLVSSAKSNGSGGATSAADGENLLVWRNYSSTKMILKGNGQLLFTGNGGPDLRTAGSTTNKLALPNTTTGAEGYLKYTNTFLSFHDGTEWRNTNGDIVESITDGVGTPHVLTARESGKTFDNTGATAMAGVKLPSAVEGMIFTFYVSDGDGFRVIANTSDTVRKGANKSPSAGYIESTTIGDCITLKALDVANWVVISSEGTGWTVST